MIANTIDAHMGGGGPDDNAAQANHLIPMAFDWQSGGDSRGLDPKDTAQLQSCQVPAVCHSLRADGFDANEDGTGRGTPLVPVSAVPSDHFGVCSVVIASKGNYSQPAPGDPCHPLAAGAHPPTIAFDPGQSAAQKATECVSIEHSPPLIRERCPAIATGFKRGQGVAARSIGYEPGLAPTLISSDSGTQQTPGLHVGMTVRRLTPRECERLQGFPDNYTLVPHRGKPAADGPRYRALGNSMAVNVMGWIGQRIQVVEDNA